MTEGRNRGLQGLAAAILNLWEKSEVVKISIKAGVRNMRNEIMAEELKVRRFHARHHLLNFRILLFSFAHQNMFSQ